MLGSAAIVGWLLQRKPPGEVELKITPRVLGYLHATVPEMGNVTPPSVERAHVLFIGPIVSWGCRRSSGSRPSPSRRCHPAALQVKQPGGLPLLMA